jgi:hypothetical protein
MRRCVVLADITQVMRFICQVVSAPSGERALSGRRPGWGLLPCWKWMTGGAMIKLRLGGIAIAIRVFLYKKPAALSNFLSKVSFKENRNRYQYGNEERLGQPPPPPTR